MTTGLTYSTYVTQLAELAVVQQTDSNFTAILPSVITYAENRMCRDIDFLSTVTTSTVYPLSTGNRSVSFPLGTFVTVQEVNVITPAGTTNPDLGTRNALLPVTKEWLNQVYNSSASESVPSYFAMLNENTIIVGPWPDNAYATEIVGTVRPQSLSATNTTTFISTYLPDLFLMASMVYISGYQRNFSGSSSNDPQMPINYEMQYQTLLKSAVIEEARKKFQSSGWTSESPAVAATPSRG